ncbi:ribose-5-phosphate isomerase [Candidatus Pacearchaeota archaeon]|jgi:ribose 5-phosphate isomerase B|nr:ribose-5-phosphate isomerase [Candidatus Pacearchaeota archaeon]|tara:strand:- start:469 stop:921 length:453 start_codon:yes stop_codon:yes gene_type:complete
MKIKKIYLSGDHAGFKLKENVKKWLLEKYEVEDIGPLVYDKKDDYPDFVIPMARKVVKSSYSPGIVIAGSGMGETIATNKVKGIKAGNYHGGSTKIIKTAREHDNLNILCMGSRFVSEEEAKEVIGVFLNTKFQSGRHSRRLGKVEKIEK